MSSSTDDGYEVALSAYAGHAHSFGGSQAALRTPAEAVAAAPATEAVKVTLSPEAKAALASMADRPADRVEATARVRELAAATGVSETEAAQLAQATRAPPPAKGAALFQANLTADRPADE